MHGFELNTTLRHTRDMHTPIKTYGKTRMKCMVLRHIHTYAHIYTHIYIYTHICTYMHIYAHIYKLDLGLTWLDLGLTWLDLGLTWAPESLQNDFRCRGAS